MLYDLQKMLRTLLILTALLALMGCGKNSLPKTEISTDDLGFDQRIVLKEGHSVVLVPENDKNLEIAVSLVDGKLSVLELDDAGKSLSVTWDDEESWTTSVMDFQENQTTTIIDNDGDGLPDLLAEQQEGSLLRYEFGTPEWIPLEPDQPKK